MDEANATKPASQWRESLRLVLLLLLGGLLSGLVGVALVFLMEGVQLVAYGCTEGSFLTRVAGASLPRRILAPLIGGALVGLGWWWLRRSGPVATFVVALERQDGKFDTWPNVADSALQVVAVGSGLSIGQEGAVRQLAAVAVSRLAEAMEVPWPQRRLAMACATGAGLAAVYNVPVSGVLFAVEILLASWKPKTILAAAVMSGIATVVMWPLSGNVPTYVFPDVRLDLPLLLWTVAAIPLCALTGWSFSLLLSLARRPGPATWRVPLNLAVVGGLIGLAAWWLPMLPGNGRSALQLTFTDGGPAWLFVVLLMAKPVATAAVWRAGGLGGTLTPALATGGALGGLVAVAVGASGADSRIASFALIAAVGVLAVTQRAPLFAAVFGFELTRPPLDLAIPLLIVAVGSYAITVVRAKGRAGRSQAFPAKPVSAPGAE